jgi:hypothetical protein
VESAATGLPERYGSGIVVRKDRANAAEEPGDENGGVALCLDVVDPLQQHGANLHE